MWSAMHLENLQVLFPKIHHKCFEDYDRALLITEPAFIFMTCKLYALGLIATAVFKAWVRQNPIPSGLMVIGRSTSYIQIVL